MVQSYNGGIPNPMKDTCKFHFLFLLFLFCSCLFYPLKVFCQEKNYFLPFLSDKALYLTPKSYVIKDKETLVDLAVQFEVGYFHLVRANQGIDPWVPPPGQSIVLPYQVLIPQEFLYPEKTYLLINIPEMRLYFFRGNEVAIFPIGIADENKTYPLGTYTVVRKQEKPIWYPPPSILAEDPTLPKAVLPGPDNPLGEYALYLDRGNYLIHGTNKEESVGRRTTHGCFRLYKPHIAFLFKQVALGTKVFIIYEPLKIAVENDKIYLQVFPDFENKVKDQFLWVMEKVTQLARMKKADFSLNLFKLEEALSRADGLVYEIGILKPYTAPSVAKEKK